MTTHTSEPIRTTGVSLVAECALRLPGCLADGAPRHITAVFDADGMQVNVCSKCLGAKLASGDWRLGGRGFVAPVNPHEQQGALGVR